MKKIVILTGSELRHSFFRKHLSNDTRFKVLATYCEGAENSLENRVKRDKSSSNLLLKHVEARVRAERDFFGIPFTGNKDYSNPKFLVKGGINNENVVRDIINLNPDILVCYGASLIRSHLLDFFNGRFLNVHLGLSPYYRGSGTNIWPLINKEPYMVGATFMYIDEGIDTGKIIHQIRADIFLGDSPHSIGNRLIAKMTTIFSDIIANFAKLSDEAQLCGIDGRVYKKRDFDSAACEDLYNVFQNRLIENYLNLQNSKLNLPKIITNKGLLQ